MEIKVSLFVKYKGKKGDISLPLPEEVHYHELTMKEAISVLKDLAKD